MILAARKLHRPRSFHRAFSITPVSQLDLSNLYSKLTGWRRKDSQKPVQDPTKQSDIDRSDNSMPTASKPRFLRVLGKPPVLEDEWPEVQQFAEFKAWPTNLHRSNLTKAQIEEALSAVQSADFSNIQARFTSAKKVSEQLNMAISDHVLTSLNTVEDLRHHIYKSAVPFDERQPDAVFLDPQDFIGTNVILSDPAAENKKRKRRVHELLQQARQAQAKETDSLMHQA